MSGGNRSDYAARKSAEFRARIEAACRAYPEQALIWARWNELAHKRAEERESRKRGRK